MIEKNAQRRLAGYLSEYAAEVVSEWMRLVEVDQDAITPGSGHMSLRARWAGDGTFSLSESGYDEEYGTYRLITRVEPVAVPPLGPENDPARQYESVTLHCVECTVDEDPRPWCDCVDGEQCHPGNICRSRAHHPSNCPKLESAEWIPSTFLHIVTGDRVRIGQEEADVTQGQVQPWHARDGEWVPSGQKKADGTDKMMKTVIKDDHWEVRAALRLATGQDLPLTLFPPETAVEILCTSARKAQLALSHAGFIGTSEVG